MANDKKYNKAIADKKRRQEARAYINDYKKKHPCIVCGTTKDLQFHHLEPDEKIYCVSDMVKMRCSIKTIDKEIKKCVILCKKCHEEHHNENLDLTKYLEEK